MGFPPDVAERVLISCRRSCAICHKFCGTKMELHHIVPASKGGEDTYENCIPLCFDCHSDVRAYDPTHPKGKKFTESELRGHRDSWYARVERGDVVVEGGKEGDAGKFQSGRGFKIVHRSNTFRPHAFLGDGRVDKRTSFTVDFDFINNQDEVVILYRPEIVSFMTKCDLLANEPSAIQFNHFPNRNNAWIFPYKFEFRSRYSMRCEIDVNLTNNSLDYFAKELKNLKNYEFVFQFTHEGMDAYQSVGNIRIIGVYDDFKNEVLSFWKENNISVDI